MATTNTLSLQDWASKYLDNSSTDANGDMQASSFLGGSQLRQWKAMGDQMAADLGISGGMVQSTAPNGQISYAPSQELLQALQAYQYQPTMKGGRAGVNLLGADGQVARSYEYGDRDGTMMKLAPYIVAGLATAGLAAGASGAGGAAGATGGASGGAAGAAGGAAGGASSAGLGAAGLDLAGLSAGEYGAGLLSQLEGVSLANTAGGIGASGASFGGLGLTEIGTGALGGLTGITGTDLLGTAGDVASTGSSWWDKIKNPTGNATMDKAIWNIGGKLLTTGALGALGAGAANALTPDAPGGGGTTAGGMSLSDIAQRQVDLADKTYADQRAIFEKYLPQMEQALQTQLGAAQTATDRSNNLWQSYTDTWAPVGQQYAQQIQTMANPARYEQAGQRAGAATAEQLDLAQATTERQLQMAGASPEKIAALQAAGRLSGAKQIAGATTAARMGAEQQGLAALQGGAQFGLNLPGMALSQQGAALSGASSAQQGVAGLNSLAAAPAALTSQMLGSAGSTIGHAAAIQNQQYQNQLQAANQRNAIIGDVLGAGLGAIGNSGGFQSFWDGIFGNGG